MASNLASTPGLQPPTASSLSTHPVTNTHNDESPSTPKSHHSTNKKDNENGNKIPLTLKGVPETMLATLALRAQEANNPRPYLNDVWAQQVLDKLDYPPVRALLKMYQFVLLRAKQLDDWASEFIAGHVAEGEGVTVLHLACGLDSRFLRVCCRDVIGDGVSGEAGGAGLSGGMVGGEGQGAVAGGKVRWIDVDLPEVVEIREKVMPLPPMDPNGKIGNGWECEYTLLARDVTDPDWLESDIPADRPTLVIMEGLLMYLPQAEVERLIRRICDRFPKGGQIIADVVGKKMLATQQHRAEEIHRMGAVMRSSVDDAAVEMAALHPRLKLRDQIRVWQRKGNYIHSWSMRITVWIWSWLPGFKTMSSDLRLEF